MCCHIKRRAKDNLWAAAIRTRFVVAMLVLFCATTAGAATTIETSADEDPVLCGQFLEMIKAAGIPEMSDAQLCDFRFEQLPPAKTRHFASVHWDPLEVKDPAAMYYRMRMANVSGPPSNDGPPWPNLMKALAEAVADHNIAFETTQVQLQGKGPEVTVTKMDAVRSCSQLPKYLHVMGVPYYAIYKGKALQHPLRIWIPHESWQMMLWKHKGLQIPVLLEIWPYWGPPVPEPHDYLNIVTLDTLVPDEVATGKFRDTVSNYGTCAYDLRPKTKPTGKQAPEK